VSSFQESKLLDEYSLSLFPNPTSDYLNISVGETSQYLTWCIRTIDVKKLSSGSLNSDKELGINISNLELGTYFLNIQSDTHILFKKFLKI